MAEKAILEKLRRPFDGDEYEAIRNLWKHHSISEDERNLDGLISTLTEDCVYELMQTGHRWEGHDGARAFYLSLLGAFPDIHFDLTDIVIGPQGVCEEAHVTGTHLGDWLGVAPTGEAVEFDVVIFFPWDSDAKKFTGEKVYFHAGAEMAGRMPMPSAQTKK